MVLMDHFKSVTAQHPHNGMSSHKLSMQFGPLLFCTAHPRSGATAEIVAYANANGLPPPPTGDATKRSLNHLDVKLAADVLTFLLELWPGRNSELIAEYPPACMSVKTILGSSESSGSENSTINLTNNGSLPLMGVWLQENRLPESTC